MKAYIDKLGNLYFGDLQPEDREATADEFAAWQAAHDKAEANNAAIEKIAAIERAAQSGYGLIPRRMRDILIAKLLPSGDTDRDALVALETSLAVERAKIQP